MAEGVLEAVIQPFVKLRSVFPTSAENYQPVERSYLIASFDLTSGGFQRVLPYAALLSDGRMPSRIIRKFDYFRADLTIKIQMVSAATTYGVVNCWMVPMEADQRATYQDLPLSDIRQFKTWSGHSGITLAIADQAGAEFNYPWPTPEHSLRTADTNTPTLFTQLAQLNFQAPSVKNITPGVTTPSVSIQVYASFRNTMLMGPRATLAPTLGAPFLQGLDSKSFKNQWTIHGDSCNYADAQMEMVTAAVTGVAIATEATLAVADLIQGVQEVKDSGINLLSKHKVEQDLLHPDIAGSTTDYNQRSGVKQSTYGDIASVTTNTSHANLGDHANQVSMDPKFVAETAVGHNIYDMCQRWFVNRTFLDWGLPSESVYTEVIHPAPSDIIRDIPPTSTVDYGYLQFFSRFYRYWRGNIDYRLQFFGSDLLVMRVLVNIHFSANALGTTSPTAGELQENAGDIFSKTFTVRGTTTIEFSAPYVRRYLWDSINDAGECNYLTVSVVDIVPAEVDGVQVSLPMYVSYRAGKNFQWQSYTGGVLNGTPESIADAQMFVNGSSSTADECTIFDGTSAPGTVADFRASTGSIYNLLRRVSVVDVLSTVNTAPGQYIFSQSPDGVQFNENFNNSRAIDKFASIFLWWTGSMRHKMYFRDFGTVETLSVTIDNPVRGVNITDNYRFKPEYGQHATEAVIWPFLEFEVPYLNNFAASQTFLNKLQNVPFVSNPLPVNLHDSGGADVPLPTQHFQTVGDDFQFYFALPPPNVLDPVVLENKHSFIPSTERLENIADAQSWFTVSRSVENRNMAVPISNQLVTLLGNYQTNGEPLTGLMMECNLDIDGIGADSDIFGLIVGGTPYTGNWQTNVANRLDMRLFYLNINQNVSPSDDIVLQLATDAGSITGTFTLNFRMGTDSPAVFNNVTLAGFTADNPLWISEAKPDQEAPPPGQDEIVITATQLQNPVWVSRAQPVQAGSLGTSSKRPVRRRARSRMRETSGEWNPLTASMCEG